MKKPLLFFILALLFFLISLIVQVKPIFQLDATFVRSLEWQRTEQLNSFMYFWTNIGSMKVQLLLTICISIFLGLRRQWLNVLMLFMNFFGVRMLNELLKVVFARERPDFHPLDHLESYSFPSGHAMNSTAVYGLFAYFLICSTNNKFFQRIVAVFVICLCLLIGLSRIYLGVHFPSDVLAGFLAGLLWLFAMIALFAMIRQN